MATLNVLNHEVKDIIRGFKSKATKDTKITVLNKLAAENDLFIDVFIKTIYHRGFF